MAICNSFLYVYQRVDVETQPSLHLQNKRYGGW